MPYERMEPQYPTTPTTTTASTTTRISGIDSTFTHLYYHTAIDISTRYRTHELKPTYTPNTGII